MVSARLYEYSSSGTQILLGNNAKLETWALSRPVYSVESTLKDRKIYVFVDDLTYNLSLCVQIFPLSENTKVRCIWILVNG